VIAQALLPPTAIESTGPRSPGAEISLLPEEVVPHLADLSSAITQTLSPPIESVVTSRFGDSTAEVAPAMGRNVLVRVREIVDKHLKNLIFIFNLLPNPMVVTLEPDYTLEPYGNEQLSDKSVKKNNEIPQKK
jgi:hypothetical protein